jgi:hypothetical protein
MPRDFFEVRFEDLLQRAETTTGMLRRLDERLARMESCLGVETRNVGSRAAVPAARS